MVEDTVPSLSGIAVHDTFRALEEMVGAGVISAALQSLSHVEREQFEQATTVSWIPMTVVGAVVDEIARLTHQDPDSMLDEAVRRAVQHTFKTAWRMLLKLTTDEALIARTPIIYAKARYVGQLSARITQPGQAELKLSGWPRIPDRHIRTVGLATQVILELAGRRAVRIHGTRNHDGVLYHLTWRE